MVSGQWSVVSGQWSARTEGAYRAFAKRKHITTVRSVVYIARRRRISLCEADILVVSGYLTAEYRKNSQTKSVSFLLCKFFQFRNT